MNEQLDNDLKKRILEVFENFEDVGADEGWLLLREKFPEEKRDRKPVIWFWSGAAAVLLLFLGFGFWLLNEKEPVKKYAYEKHGPKDTIYSTPINKAHLYSNKTKSNKEKTIVSSENNHLSATNKPSSVADNRLFATNKPSSAHNNLSSVTNKPSSVYNNHLSISSKPTSVHNSRLFASNKPSSAHNKRLPATNKHLSANQLFAINLPVHSRISRSFSKNLHKAKKAGQTPDQKNNYTKTSPLLVIKTHKNRDTTEEPGTGTDSINVSEVAVNKISDQTPGQKNNYTKTSPLLVTKTRKNRDTTERAAVGADSIDVSEVAVNKIAGQNSQINIQPAMSSIKAEKDTLKKPAKSINTMFAEDQNKKEQRPIEKNRKIKLGLYEATYVNYAKGSSNNVNIGAGLTAGIYLGNNLELVTGLAIGQNSLSYDNNIPPASQSYLDYASSSHVVSPALTATAAYTNFSPATTVKNYSAGLVGLEIPVNLKYALNSRKNSIYFSAGFSSGTFISETYTYQYYYSASSAPYAQQTQQQATNKNFDNFYFAKTLNLSLGEGVPFGKNTLIIEPFLKYPLAGLGAQDIHFGAGGINLKFNFVTSKK